MLLDCPAKRPGAEVRIVSLVDQELLGVLVQVQFQAVIGLPTPAELRAFLARLPQGWTGLQAMLEHLLARVDKAGVGIGIALLRELHGHATPVAV